MIRPVHFKEKQFEWFKEWTIRKIFHDYKRAWDTLAKM